MSPKAVAAKVIAKIRTREFLNSLQYLFSSVAASAISLVTIPFFTKYLDPEQYGIYGYVVALNSIMFPVFQLGLSQFYLTKYYITKDSSDKGVLLSTALTFSLVWTVLLNGLLYLTLRPAFELAGINLTFLPYMYIALVSNLMLPFITYGTMILRIKGRAFWFSLLTVLQVLLTVLPAMGLIYYYGMEAEARFWGMVVGNALIGLICLFILLKVEKFAFSWQVAKEGIRFGLPLVLTSLLFLAYDNMDRFFLEDSVSLADLGFYNVGAQLAMLVQMLTLALYKAYEPVSFQQAKEGQYEALVKNFNFQVISLGVWSVALVLGVDLLAGLLINERYAASLPIGRVLIVAMLLKSSYTMVTMLLTAQTRTRLILKITIGGFLLYLGLNYWLIPLYGTWGAAIARVLLFVGLCLGAVLLSGHTRAFRSFLLINLGLVLLLGLIIVFR